MQKKKRKKQKQNNMKTTTGQWEFYTSPLDSPTFDENKSAIADR